MGWDGGAAPIGQVAKIMSWHLHLCSQQQLQAAASSQQLLPTRIFKLFLPCPNTARYSHPLPRSLYSSYIFGLKFSLNSLEEYIFKIVINIKMLYQIIIDSNLKYTYFFLLFIKCVQYFIIISTLISFILKIEQ